MIKLLYQPTAVKISTNARKRAKLIYGSDYASLMFSSIKRFETPQRQSKLDTAWKNLVNRLGTKTKLTLSIDVNKDKNFTVTAKRKIGSLSFAGKPVEFPLSLTLRTHKIFEEAVIKSKENILELIHSTNKYKKHTFLKSYKKSLFML